MINMNEAETNKTWPMSGFEIKLLPAEIEFMNLLDVSVEHLTLVWIICVRMLPFFCWYFWRLKPSPNPNKKCVDISRKQPRVNAPRSSAKNIPRINQWRDLRFVAGIVTSLGAVCGNIAGIFGGRRQMYHLIWIYIHRNLLTWMLHSQTNASFLETVQPEFHRFTRSQQSCTGKNV